MRSLGQGLGATVGALRNPAFARLYLAQLTHLLGDALVWVAIAVLAYDLAGPRAAAVLGIALTLRVAAFVLLSPIAGVVADRVSRKAILVVALVARMGVLAYLATATQEWHLYLGMLAMNAVTAFFTPTYQASVPAVTTRAEYPKAIALSGATFEMLGVLGPGLAGGLAVAFGGRMLFWVAGATAIAAALLILSLRRRLDGAAEDAPAEAAGDAPRAASERGWGELTAGTRSLWRDPVARYGLSLELVASVAGAWILVNSVVLVKGGLGLGDGSYGWLMAVFGAGATAAALALGALEGRWERTRFMLVGALAISIAVLPANLLGFGALLPLWLLAGVGTNWVNLPMLTLLAERTPAKLQGRVYGAHFAWSHLWWLGAYPLAGWLGSIAPDRSFLVGGALSLLVLVLVERTLGTRSRLAVSAPPSTVGR